MVVHVTTAYDECTPPDTNSTSGFGACTALAPADPLCRFGVRGRGKVGMSVRPDDIRVNGSLRGIDPACEGQRLQLQMTLRATSNDCPPGAVPGNTCTMTEMVDVPIVECQVSGGSCKFDANINTAIPDLIRENNRTHLHLLGCAFVRTTGAALPNSTFRCGLMVP
jgi:hypothetical protein